MRGISASRFDEYRERNIIGAGCVVEGVSANLGMGVHIRRMQMNYGMYI